LEKIRAAREEPQDNGRATAPSAAMTPLPFAPPAPAKSEIELKAEEIKASLAQLAQKSRTRDPNMPDWTPQWMERQSTPARRGGYCEVAVVCEWKDIFVSIVLAPEDGKSPPVRALASRPSVELIDALPGTLRVEIDGWLPSQQAPVPIYRSQSKRVEKGVRYKLILAADESARIRQFLAETRDRQEEPLTGKKPKEVKFAPSGAAQ
jgi:hypothetical protein